MLLRNIVVYAFMLSIFSFSKGQDPRLDNIQHPAVAKLVKMRCTRRFSPGVCSENVAPVWTFVFLAQNCTERLGCPNNYRTNRFGSYRMCMKRCRALVDMYLRMVEFEEANTAAERNDTSVGEANNDTEKEDADKHLRLGDTKYFITKFGANKEFVLKLGDLADTLAQDVEEEEYKGEEETRAIVYKDINANEDILPVDVDYVGGEIRSEIDLLHS